jgi:hypothetical protein
MSELLWISVTSGEPSGARPRKLKLVTSARKICLDVAMRSILRLLIRTLKIGCTEPS